MLKKLIAAFLFVCPLVFANWEGDVEKPSVREIDGKEFYEIANPENLAWFAVQVNKGNLTYNAILTDDIVVWEDSVSSETIEWTPMGIMKHANDENGFSGIFDGNGHFISGIYVPAKYFAAGFFGRVAPKGVVKNLTLKNILIEGIEEVLEYEDDFSYATAGGIAGTFSGDSLVNCEVHGVIDGPNMAGGLAGEIHPYSPQKTPIEVVRDCRNFATIKNGLYCGGLFGVADFQCKVIIVNSKNAGYVNCIDYNGGLVGYSGLNMDIDSSANAGEVASQDGKGIAAGFVSARGSETLLNITNSENNGRILGGTFEKRGSCAGGFVAVNEGVLNIDNCVNNGEITVAVSSKKGHMGGFVGYSPANLDISRSVNRGYVNGLAVSGGFVGSTDSLGAYNITYCVNEGRVGSAQISGEANGGFIGEGRGNLKMNNVLNTASIYGNTVGGIMGDFLTRYRKNYKKSIFDIKNAVNEGELTGSAYVAGIVALVMQGKTDTVHQIKITDSYNRGNINAVGFSARAGGIVAHNLDSLLVISKSKNEGNILVDVSTTTSSSSVSGVTVGGIVGSATRTAVLECENYGNIYYVDSVRNDLSYTARLAGIAGNSAYLVRGSKNEGSITVTPVEAPSSIYVSGIANSPKQVTGNLNEGRMELAGNATMKNAVVAGISYNASGASGNLNKGNLINRVAANENALYATCSGYTHGAASLSISDSLMLNGAMTVGKKGNACAYVDKEKLGLGESEEVFAFSSKDIKTLDFAWFMNTCGESLENMGMWSQKGEEYPIIADAVNRPIYKVTFIDSSKAIKVNPYTIGTSFTNASGYIVDFAEGPDPSKADPDLRFGYWAYQKEAILEKSIIRGDDSLYATFVDKDVEPLMVSFIVDGISVADYIVSAKGTYVNLPSVPRSGRKFLGWFDGDSLYGDAGASVKFNAAVSLVAKYESLYYAVSFLNANQVLQRDSLLYGELPVFMGEIPQKENVKFAGWAPEIQPVTANVAYFATFNSIGLEESSSSVSESSSSMTSSSSVAQSSSSVAPSSSSQAKSSSSVASSSSVKSSSSVAQSSSSQVKSSSSVASSSSEAKQESSSSVEESSSSEHTTVAWNDVQPTFNLAVNGMTLTLSNTQGGVVRIFDALGHMVAAKPIATATTSITLQTPGNYIVRVNGMSQSVTLK